MTYIPFILAFNPANADCFPRDAPFHVYDNDSC